MHRLQSIQTELSLWKNAVVPYVERAFRGRRGQVCAVLAIAFWVATACFSFTVVHGDSAGDRDWRRSLNLEDPDPHWRYRDVAWSQCGYCVTTFSDKSRRELEEELAAVDIDAFEECVNTEESRFEDCRDIPYAVRDAVQSIWLDRRIVFEGVHEDLRVTETTGLTATQRWATAAQQQFKPNVERYRSPLDSSDFARVWGLVCAWCLVGLTVVLIPLRIVTLIGNELYQQTWSLLVATQQPVERLTFALLAEAIAPLALLGAPLYLTVVGAMLLGAGPWFALAFTLGAGALLAVATAFAVTLVSVAGRHAAPALLILLTVFPCMTYLVATFGMDLGVSGISGELPELLLTHSGVDTWRAAQQGFLELPLLDYVHGRRMLANLGVIGGGLAWIWGHARRIQPQAKPAMSRSVWLGSWTLSGWLVAQRWIAVAEQREEAVKGWETLDHMVGFWMVSLAIPLALYLRSRCYPGVYRQDARADVRGWRHLAVDGWLALACCMAGAFLAGGSPAYAMQLALTSAGGLSWLAIQCSFVFVAAGGALVFARGLSTLGSRIGFVALAFSLAAWLPSLADAIDWFHGFPSRSASLTPFEGSAATIQLMIMLAGVAVIAWMLRSNRGPHASSTSQ